jgi:hypothetical protein
MTHKGGAIELARARAGSELGRNAQDGSFQGLS